jgi:glycerol-3-phosphate dehydrogenase subunit B
VTDPEPRVIHTRLAVIGTGLAGMCAALFASRRGVPTAAVGMTSQIIFASGLIDLWGDRGAMDPWAGLAQLRADQPRHPLARVPDDRIHAALSELFDVLDQNGLPYHHRPRSNRRVITPVGRLKPTYGAPESMKNMVDAVDAEQPMLVVDFEGLREFSAKLIQRELSGRLPGLASIRVSMPGLEDRPSLMTGEIMAQALEHGDRPEMLAERVRPHLGPARAVGFPAVLGLGPGNQIIERLETALGLPVFELPTLPASVPGLRLKNALEQGLGRQGVQLMANQKVLRVRSAGDGFRLEVGRSRTECILEAQAVLLASGRFLGQGLAARRTGVRETIFDLPAFQPAGREQWHRPRFLAAEGHPVNQAGLDIDHRFRPLAENGRPAHQGLFAAGAILAHQDWPRQRCGGGLAAATAWMAVESFLSGAEGIDGPVGPLFK